MMTLATCGHLHGPWFGVLMFVCGLAMLGLCAFFHWGSGMDMSEDYVKPRFMQDPMGWLGVGLFVAFTIGGVVIGATT